MTVRRPKVWCDEDTSAAETGDFYVDCMGTWIIDANGDWRGYHHMTETEKALCSAVIDIERLEKAHLDVQPFVDFAVAVGDRLLKAGRPDLLLGLAAEAADIAPVEVRLALRAALRNHARMFIADAFLEEHAELMARLAK